MSEKDLTVENPETEAITSVPQEKGNNLWKKATAAGKRFTESVQKGVTTLSEKAKNDSLARRLKKYNPLFPEQYASSAFALPNMIVIVDDAVRRDIDVCVGAIGWTGTENNTEILYLYDEFIPDSGLTFIPAPACDAIYYVDKFDRTRFIQIDCIFEKAHEEKLAELEHIAYSLGAKLCSIEIVEGTVTAESTHKSMASSKKGAIKGIDVSSSVAVDQMQNQKSSSHRSGKSVTHFTGNVTPTPPTLKWFAHDDSIRRLVEMCCSSGNTVRERTLEIKGSSTATLSQKAAYAIDCALSKIGTKEQGQLEKQATREQHCTLIFEIVF